MKSKLSPYAPRTGIHKHLQKAINLILKYTFETGMMNSLLKVPCFHPNYEGKSDYLRLWYLVLKSLKLVKMKLSLRGKEGSTQQAVQLPSFLGPEAEHPSRRLWNRKM